MPINVRNKGANGEREVADMLNGLVLAVTGTYGDFHRNLEQSQGGGFDLVSMTYPHFAIEVKRVEALTPSIIQKFWEQTERQARLFTKRQSSSTLITPTLTPILIYRQNRKPWRIRTWGHLAYVDASASFKYTVVEVAYEDFCVWFSALIGALARETLLPALSPASPALPSPEDSP